MSKQTAGAFSAPAMTVPVWAKSIVEKLSISGVTGAGSANGWSSAANQSRFRFAAEFQSAAPDKHPEPAVLSRPSPLCAIVGVVEKRELTRTPCLLE
jgi:hypothetical protein